VIFTGHSLGGAIANLAAFDFANARHHRSFRLYTFGQPRVGDEKYANAVSTAISNHFRVVHKKDIVPHKPAYFFFSYRHAGSEVWYLNGPTSPYHICSE
jgi:predicted lipase